MRCTSASRPSAIRCSARVLGLRRIGRAAFDPANVGLAHATALSQLSLDEAMLLARVRHLHRAPVRLGEYLALSDSL